MIRNWTTLTKCFGTTTVARRSCFGKDSLIMVATAYKGETVSLSTFRRRARPRRAVSPPPSAAPRTPRTPANKRTKVLVVTETGEFSRSRRATVDDDARRRGTSRKGRQFTRLYSLLPCSGWLPLREGIYSRLRPSLESIIIFHPQVRCAQQKHSL